MSYDSIANVSSMLGLLLFVMLFAGVLWWAFRPKNRGRFRDAARIPLEEPDLVDREHKNPKP
jgi:cytochrome c oxidase cbb3-type subunit IV